MDGTGVRRAKRTAPQCPQYSPAPLWGAGAGGLGGLPPARLSAALIGGAGDIRSEHAYMSCFIRDAFVESHIGRGG